MPKVSPTLARGLSGFSSARNSATCPFQIDYSLFQLFQCHNRHHDNSPRTRSYSTQLILPEDSAPRKGARRNKDPDLEDGVGRIRIWDSGSDSESTLDM
jgi:hypothetical protein